MNGEHRPAGFGDDLCSECRQPWPCDTERAKRRAGYEAWKAAVIPADPDRACDHQDFAANVDVARINHDPDPTIVAFAAEVKIECARCGERFRFIGMRAGLLATEPACSIDEFEARLPIRPASSDPDFGLGIPGFAVQVRDET